MRLILQLQFLIDISTTMHYNSPSSCSAVVTEKMIDKNICCINRSFNMTENLTPFFFFFTHVWHFRNVEFPLEVSI